MSARGTGFRARGALVSRASLEARSADRFRLRGTERSTGRRVFGGLVGMFGDSNVVGISSYNATGGMDTSFGVSDVSGYAPVRLIRRWSGAITNPVTWSDADYTLRAYAAPPAANSGYEQALGRRIVELGLHASPVISLYGLSGSTQHTHWIPGGTIITNPDTLINQYIAWLLSVEATVGKEHDCLICTLGENDTSNSTNANATLADLQAIFAAIRTGLGRPDLLIYIVRINNATTGAFTTTVRTGQYALPAAEGGSPPLCEMIDVDNIDLGSANPHYPFRGYMTYGDYVVRQMQRDFTTEGDTTHSIGSGPSAWFNDYGSTTTIAAGANGVVCAGSQERAGVDLQILLLTGQSQLSAPSLTVAAGFTFGGSGESIFGGTNHRSFAWWWRLVDQATLDANNGRMPNPTVTNGASTATSGAVILSFRSPTGWASNPVEFSQFGANNANSAVCVFPTGAAVSAVANELGVILASVPATSSAGPLSSSVSGTGIGGNTWTKKREGIFTQTTFAGWCCWTTPIPTAGTAFGNPQLNYAAAGVNAGFFLALKPST